MKATLTELYAVFSVAAPFIGFGLTEWSGDGLYFILGAGVFCAWMMLVPLLFLGTYKRRIANRTAEANQETTETTDAATPADA